MDPNTKFSARTLFILLVMQIIVTTNVSGQLEGIVSPTADDVIKQRGFIAERYKLESADGFPLTMHRIINPLANPATLNKYPVVYGHGVLFDSLSMLQRSENTRPRKPVLGQPTIKYANNQSGDHYDDHSLPFMLSNNNFDVWMYDSRGTNEINRASVDKDLAKEHRFWDYSLDEQGIVDLPKLIDFVLLKTGAPKVAYVGFSESTFFLFALLSTYPEYSDKVVAAATMAPVAYVAHIRGLTVPLLAPMAVLTPSFVETSFVPRPVINAIDTTLKYLCRYQNLQHAVCGTLLNSIGGFGNSEHGKEFYENFYKSTSLKSIRHFLQLLLTNRFGRYDYGALENLKRYGQITAPNYDMSKFRFSGLIMVRGLSDFLSTPEDQQRLISEMAVKPYADIVIPEYNHFDFIDGKNLIEKVNGPVVTKFYELMYRDGPNILKSSVELSRARPNIVTPTDIQLPSQSDGLMSHHERQSEGNDFMGQSKGIFDNIMSGPQQMFDNMVAMAFARS